MFWAIVIVFASVLNMPPVVAVDARAPGGYATKAACEAALAELAPEVEALSFSAPAGVELSFAPLCIDEEPHAFYDRLLKAYAQPAGIRI